MRDNHVKVHRGFGRALIGAAAASLLALAMWGPAAAKIRDDKGLSPYEIGLAAYENGQYQQAIDIWRRFAVAGDVRSKKILGDVYSGKILEDSRNLEVPLEAIKTDNVESLKWYTLAAYHDFSAYQFAPGKQPAAEDVNASIVATQRLPDIRFRMSDADVIKAETQVSETFQRGSPYDLYRLGDMYQRGAGVSKNNTKALLMYTLAKQRGVGEASIAAEEVEKLMTKVEIKMAMEQSGTWQPPLPIELVGSTPQMVENERLRKELEEIKLEDALEAVSDIDVELLQRALRALGFYYGTIDNNMGPETRQAIRRFQYSRVSSDTEMSDADKEAVKTGVLSPRQTVELIGAAAAANHPMSQYVYGIMHVRGIGVNQNGQEAVTWLTKAANADLAIAHYALGVIYRDGTTGLNEVTPSKALAAQHFARGYALGYKPAGDALRLLEFEAPRNVE
jgi:TPR repeat protein